MARDHRPHSRQLQGELVVDSSICKQLFQNGQNSMKTYYAISLLQLMCNFASLCDINFQCLLHTWFLSNDIQFHIVSVTAILLLHKSPRKGLWNIAIYLVAATFLAGYLTYSNNYPPHSVTTIPEIE